MAALSPQALRLKAATRRLVEACGGQESAALIPGMPISRHQTFSEAGNATVADRFLRVDLVALMEADCGQPILTEQLARATGHVLVRLPEIARSGLPLGRVTGEAMKEVSDVFGKLGEFLDDGTLSAVEGARLDTEIDEAIVKLLALRAQIDALAGKDRS